MWSDGGASGHNVFRGSPLESMRSPHLSVGGDSSMLRRLNVTAPHDTPISKLASATPLSQDTPVPAADVDGSEYSCEDGAE